MNLTDVLTLIVLFVNTAALIFVIYQTRQNRKSIDLATQSIDDQRRTTELTQQSIDHQRRVLQMELLPRESDVGFVHGDLIRWKEQIKETVEAIEMAVQNQDEEAMNRIAARAIKTPKGLIRRMLYEHVLEWLQKIWMAGAQYYYDFESVVRYLSREEYGGPVWHFAPDVIERGKDHATNIGELLEYVDQAVPEAYLNSPASLRNDDFLSD